MSKMDKKVLHTFAILYYFPTKCYKLATIAIQILIKSVFDFGNRVLDLWHKCQKKKYARKTETTGERRIHNKYNPKKILYRTIICLMHHQDHGVWGENIDIITICQDLPN